jgi:hypothetical protein
MTALYGCSGSESTLPTGSSFGSEKSVRPNLSAAAVSGIVKNALDGQPVGGITVEIPGVASVTTGGDGAFTLDGTAGAPLPLVLRGDGFHMRETHMVSSTVRAEIDILPIGRDFDLDFFDHVFRNLGEGHTLRWTEEPRFEIWTGVYERVEGEFYGDFVATGEVGPDQYVQIALDVIAWDAPKYTGGVIQGTDILVLPPHAAGTRLTYHEYFKAFTISVLLLAESGTSYGPSWSYESGRLYSASIWFERRFKRDERQVFSHELAHTLGFFHPAQHENVPLPSIMRDAVALTKQDELHGRILYRRPPGSRTADKDPESFVVNALRSDAESGPPDPALIRLVRD